MCFPVILKTFNVCLNHEGHRKCPPLQNIEHGGKFYVTGTELKEVANTGRDCKDVRDGNSCHYECDTGYRLLNGTKVMKCNPWGRWEGTVPRCESMYIFLLQI